jgi:septal ring factor EnvC (AmiA/AmiB activator)
MIKKIWKYTIGFFTLVGGILLSALVLGSKKNKKVKEIKSKIKKTDKNIKSVNKKINNVKKANKKVNKSLKNKKKDLKKIKTKKKGYKAKSVGANEATDFLKNYSKKKRNNKEK